jgi:hypothetical protein
LSAAHWPECLISASWPCQSHLTFNRSGRRTYKETAGECHVEKSCSRSCNDLIEFSSSIEPALSHSGFAKYPWNPAHLGNLPSEIRARVRKWEVACRGPVAAAQQFALYLTIPGTQFVALHFDDFRCQNKSVLRNGSGCLHEVYASSGGRYRRVLTVYARDIRLVRQQNAALVEIHDDASGVPRTVRLNGN